MYSLKIESVENLEDLILVVEIVLDQLKQGYNSGYEPAWSIVKEDDDEEQATTLTYYPESNIM